MVVRPWSVAFQAYALVATVGCGGGKSSNPQSSAAGNGGTGPGGGGMGASAGGRSATSGGKSSGALGGAGSGVSGMSGAGVTGGGAGALAGGGGTSAAGSPGVGGMTLGGAAGAGGKGGGGGTGLGTPELCGFELEATLSTAIPTVGIVDWSTDLADLDSARIEFTLNDPATDELNRGSGGAIDITGTTHRALMLGLKAERPYTYRIVASAGETDCVSADQQLTTGPAVDVLEVKQTLLDPSARAPGFIVTTGYYIEQAVIIDADGDVVWWAKSPSQSSRALLDWAGESLWILQTNSSPNAGELRRVGMDGTGSVVIDAPARAHHDLTVLPGGTVAMLVWSDDESTTSDLVERSPDGTLRTVARLDDRIFKSRIEGGSSLHTNSVLYHPSDDSYTVGDVYAGTYVKLTREGDLVWQVSGDCADSPSPKCAVADTSGNHGHHLLDNGNLVFFKASFSTVSPTHEYALTEEASSLTASMVWSYTSAETSMVLGDVQRLPNGNTLVVYSTDLGADGIMHEVSPSNELVRTLNARSFGYANFRETLYGPPLK